jgi:ribosomal protein S10
MWTILKGPFKHKKHRDQIGIIRHRHFLSIATSRENADKFLEFLKVNTHPLIAIRVRIHDYIPVTNYYTYNRHYGAILRYK